MGGRGGFLPGLLRYVVPANLALMRLHAARIVFVLAGNLPDAEKPLPVHSDDPIFRGHRRVEVVYLRGAPVNELRGDRQVLFVETQRLPDTLPRFSLLQTGKQLLQVSKIGPPDAGAVALSHGGPAVYRAVLPVLIRADAPVACFVAEGIVRSAHQQHGVARRQVRIRSVCNARH